MPNISEVYQNLDGSLSIEFDDGTNTVKKLVNSITKGDTLALMQDLCERYNAEQVRANSAGSHFVEVPTSVPTADQPTITGISATPATDLGSTPFIVKPWGIDCDSVANNYQLTVAEKIAAKKWMKGFSVGAASLASGLAVRCGASMATYGTTGSAGLNATDNWGYDGAVQYTDFVFDGTTLYARILTGVDFWLWVNDRLISVAAGVNTSYSSTTLAYQSTVGGHGYIKIVFPSSSRRNIRIGIGSNAQMGNLYCAKSFTITPRCTAPIEWVHFGDSFSAYTGVSGSTRCLSHYFSESFGRDINFINVAQGSTSFANPSLNDIGGTTAATKAKFIQQFQSWKQNSPKIITALIGHNDVGYINTTLAAKLREFIAAMKQSFPDALVVFFGTNASPGLISGASDIAVENLLQGVSAEYPGYIEFIKLQTDSYGAFLRGTGYVGATNGTGNTDVYTGSDGTHPSQTGHKAYGSLMAEKMVCLFKQKLSTN